MLAYAGGGLNTVLQIAFKPGRYGVSQYFGVQQDALAIALAVACATAALLLAVSRLEKPLVPSATAFVAGQREALSLGLIMAIVAYAFASGQLGYKGIQLAGGSRSVSVVGSLAFTVNAAGAVFALYCCLKSETKSYKLFFGASFLLLLILLIPQGRRIFTYTLVLVLMAVNLASDKNSFGRSKVKLIVAAVLGLALVYLTFQFFFALRLATYSLGSASIGEAVSLTELISKAYELLVAPSWAEELEYKLSENILERTFILRYFAELIAGSFRGANGLGGEVLVHSFLVSVPSLFLSDKSTLLSGESEQFILTHFSYTYVDSASTILTEGFADFLLIGSFIYCFVTVAVLYIFLNIVRKSAYYSLYIFILFGILLSLFQAETSLAGVFASLRNWLLIFVCLKLIEWARSAFSKSIELPLRAGH